MSTLNEEYFNLKLSQLEERMEKIKAKYLEAQTAYTFAKEQRNKCDEKKILANQLFKLLHNPDNKSESSQWVAGEDAWNTPARHSYFMLAEELLFFVEFDTAMKIIELLLATTLQNNYRENLAKY